MILICPNCQTKSEDMPVPPVGGINCPACGVIMTNMSAPPIQNANPFDNKNPYANNNPYGNSSPYGNNSPYGYSSSYNQPQVNLPVPNTMFWIAAALIVVQIILALFFMPMYAEFMNEVYELETAGQQGELPEGFFKFMGIAVGLILTSIAGLVFTILDAIKMDKCIHCGMLISLLLIFLLPVGYFLYRGIKSKNTVITVFGVLYIVAYIGMNIYSVFAMFDNIDFSTMVEEEPSYTSEWMVNNE